MGTSPLASRATRSVSMSAHTTSCPSCEKHAAVVSPTYPAPMTAICAIVSPPGRLQALSRGRYRSADGPSQASERAGWGTTSPACVHESPRRPVGYPRTLAGIAERFAVRNALGAVQSLLVLGGSSDIGAAIAEKLVPAGCRRVVLAGRRPDAMEPVAERLRALGADVTVTAWDATDIAGHADAVKAAWEAGSGTGPADIDCVVLAAGVLGDQDHLAGDPGAAAELITTNFTGPASTLLHVAERLREQGHGHIVVLSTVAGERVRRSNFVYGSSKAGLGRSC